MAQRTHLPLGPVMLDVAGKALTDAERDMLRHPAVGGVILFARNYESPEQLDALVRDIHHVRTPPLLVAVDHEGGRVQRFRDGFTRLPPMGALGRLWDRDPERARELSRFVGQVLALELRAHGVDFSFTPVLDIDYGQSTVIGDRAFHRDPGVIATLACALVRGLSDGGMGSVGKHFPGHGYAVADTHHEAAIDMRPFAEIEASDLVPFQNLVSNGLTGVMPAHVIYPAVDGVSAGFSRRWLQDILRHRLGFDGVIFSDDLSMAGAHTAGPIVTRARAALDAGCDMVLVCNDSASARTLIEGLGRASAPRALAAFGRLHGHPRPKGWTALQADRRYRHAHAAMERWAREGGDLPLA